MVVDDEATIEDEDTTIQEVISAGAQVIDDSRTALMHNKFMILDSTIVWMGSTNYTFNDVYRNNNNMIMMRSRQAVQAYQTEFNEMFERGEFGQSRSQVNSADFTLDGTRVQILFAPEDNVIPTMVDLIDSAQSSIYFMTFSFTVTEIGQAVLDRADAGVTVEGVFETTGSETRFSQLTPLFCAGLDVRQDGNRGGMLHHKVFIIDESIVLTGSFNISANATDSNDENLTIIYDPDLAAQYMAEFRRMQSQATRPTDLTCS
jgi:phosphatidylserine/phosphatidylglycerophosphate/cardiolipin synthase-like enzyme